MRKRLLFGLFLAACCAPSANAAHLFRLTEGNPQLKQAGTLAFGPQGVLFVGDNKSAAVFAIDTGDKEGDAAKTSVNVEDLGEKLALAVGVAPGEVTINDMAVNPLSGNIYLSLSKGADETPALASINGHGDISEIALDNVWFSKAEIADAPEDRVVGEGRRARNRRSETITDLAFVEGNVIVSGMTNRESASGVRSIAFPFGDQANGGSIEIYHAAHGRSEDNAAIRTFVPFVIDGKPNVLAGFTCTPLVRFPLDGLNEQGKLKGTTVAELGNRNQPLDMITYEQAGKTYLLLSNSARGVMKISTDAIEQNEGLTEPVRGGGTAGQSYQTIDELQGVVQLDRLNDAHAVVIVNKDNQLNLQTVPLP